MNNLNLTKPPFAANLSIIQKGLQKKFKFAPRNTRCSLKND